MDFLSNLALGIETAFTSSNLLFCLLGVTLGMLVGVLPGIGSMVTISMLLPLTYYLEPETALIMLGGIYYGGQYGGSTASILLNLPGTPANAVTCLDGYPMAQQGRAGVALFITAVSSFVGGSFSILLMMLLAPFLSGWALHFGPSEYFAVMTFALVAGSTLSGGSALKGLSMVTLGVLLGLIGMDIGTGQYRFMFGFVELADGLHLVAIAMGLFGVAEILVNLSGKNSLAPVPAKRIPLRSLLPDRADIWTSAMPTIRGTLIGAACGILPGIGATAASFMSYITEKRIGANPGRFGKGAIEGVAAPEAANNAAVQAAFIPTLTLGVPGDAVMAVMLGAMLVHGVVPGPQIMESEPSLFWGLVVSFWIGNAILLVLNIPLIGIWVRILSVPYHLLYPGMLFLIAVGVYSINYSSFDVLTVIIFGIVGYGMRLLGYPPAPLLLGFILGPLVEDHLRRALLLGFGDPTTLVSSPISAGFLLASFFVIVLVSGRQIRTLWTKGIQATPTVQR